MKRALQVIGWAGVLLPCLAIVLSLALFGGFSEAADGNEGWTGRGIMDEVFRRHELFPSVFEQQTMILIDAAGNRTVRMARRFSRVENHGTVKFLLVLDNPSEVRGVALLVILYGNGLRECSIYLPALGKEISPDAGKDGGGFLLGTDFSMEDLMAEGLSDFRYVRVADHTIDKTSYFVVEAVPENEEVKRFSNYSLRRHFIRKDIFFIVRTDYYDRRGRFFKRQSSHDLMMVDGHMWRANMILMENHKERHKTLLKITKRVFSQDYVSPEMFTSEWLLANRHVQGAGGRFFESASRSFGKNDDPIPGDDDTMENRPGKYDFIDTN